MLLYKILFLYIIKSKVFWNFIFWDHKLVVLIPYLHKSFGKKVCRSSSKIFTSCYLSPVFVSDVLVFTLLVFTVRASCSYIKENCSFTTFYYCHIFHWDSFYKSKSLLSRCRDSKHLDRIAFVQSRHTLSSGKLLRGIRLQENLFMVGDKL